MAFGFQYQELKKALIEYCENSASSLNDIARRCSLTDATDSDFGATLMLIRFGGLLFIYNVRDSWKGGPRLAIS